MNKKLLKNYVNRSFRSLFFVMLLLFVTALNAQVTVTIPVNNDNDNWQNFPYGCADAYQRVQALYTANEIGLTGNITAVSFYVNALSNPASSTPVVIKMKNTKKTQLSISSYDDASATATNVYSGSILNTQLTANGWVTVVLNTPFTYAGYNLEVLVETNNGFQGEDWDSKQFRWSDMASNVSQTWNGWNSPPGPLDMGYVQAAHPNIKFTIANAPAMTYDTTIVEQVVSSAYKGVTNQPVIAIKVNTLGLNNPLSINGFNLSTNGSGTSFGLIQNAKLYYTSISDEFDTINQFGSTVISPSGTLSFTGNRTLDAGTNYFWLAYDIDQNAMSGDSVDAECSQVTLGVTNYPTGSSAPDGNIKIGYNYSFDTTTNQGFLVESFNNNPNQWQRGVPTQGPSAAYNGTNCWGTNLSGDINPNSEYTLTTPAFAVTSTDLSVSYKQWFDFGYMYNYLDAVFEYDINNTGWIQLDYIDPYIKYTTNNNWENKFIQLGLNIGDTVRFRWHVTTYQYTDPSSGWYIDNFVITGGSTFSQQYITSNVNQIGGLAFSGQKNLPVINVVVETNGSENPLVLSNLDFSTSGTGTISNIQAARVYYTGISRQFDTTQAFGIPVISPSGTFSVTGNQPLVSGNNHFWLVYDVANSALAEDSLDALCSQITVTSVRTPAITDPAGKSIVATLIDFDTTALEGFTTKALMSNINEWQKGTPSSGPSSPYSGSDCWGTNLNGYYSQNAQYSLETPPYVATASEVSVGFKQWFDFMWTWAGIDAEFQYQTNNGFWSTAYAVDNSTFENSDNKWQDIVNQFTVNVGDTMKFRWRFTTSQWSSTADGWFIDNFAFAGLKEFDQVYKSATSETHMGLTFPGMKNQQVLKVIVEMAGSVNPLNLTALDFNTNGTATFGIIDSAKVYYTGTNDEFKTVNAFGSTVANPLGTFGFTGTQQLEAGLNYFWLVYDIDAAAVINDSVDAEFTQLTVASVMQTPLVTAPIGNVAVGRLYDFDTAGLQNFSARSLNFNPNQWQKGAPNSGPYGAFSGNDCWATNLNGNTNTNAEYELVSPPFVATSAQINTSFMQWFDFAWTWSNIEGAFEYRVNGSGWSQLYFIDNTMRANSNYNWEEVTSTVFVNLYDTVEFRWKYRTDQWSPMASGWYVDNFGISGVEMFNQQYVSSNVDGIYESTLAGRTNQPVIDITVDAIGGNNALTVTNFDLNTGGSVAGIIQSAKIFYTGTDASFDTTQQFGSLVALPSGNFAITGTQQLSSGRNHFWLTYDVSQSALVGDSLDAICTQIIIASIQQTPSQTAPAGTIPVAMLVHFDTTTAQNFSVAALNNGANQWQRGTPNSGPYASLSGTNCWATNLNGNFNSSSEYVLNTPPYVAKSDVIYISYQQWFDFAWTYNDVIARFQYNVNNTGWITAMEIDNYMRSNSDYNWEKASTSIGSQSGDTVQFRWYFSTSQWSSPSSGWYIDDFTASGVETFGQFYQSSYAEQIPGATFAGAKAQPVLRIAVEMAGSNNPLNISNLTFATNGSGVAITDQVRLFYTGTNAEFDTTTQFGSAVTSPVGSFMFNGSENLAAGTNYFWLAYDVSATATPGDSLDADFSQLTIAFTPQTPTNTSPAGNLPVGKVYDFDGLSNEDFISASLSNSQADWERGAPTYMNGPSASYSGTKCWGTSLAGDFSLSNEVTLTTPSFLVTGTIPYINYKEWFEFIYTSWNKEAAFEYRINNTGSWQMLSGIDLMNVASSNNNWLNDESFPSAAIGDTLQFRWRLYTDQWDAAPGWYIDNFLVAGMTPVDLYGPSITYTKLNNTSLLTNRTLTSFAEISDIMGVDVAFGNKPRIYYKKSSEANAFAGNASFNNGWKYAEASNNSSPFSFVIDYSLLTSAVSVSDTIQYFVAAQDLNLNPNVGANPSEGFAATNINAIVSAPTAPEMFIITAGPMSGNYNVGTGQTYTTLTAAVNDVNMRGINGPVTLSLTNSATYNLANGETFPITLYPVTGASATNTVTIKPASGVNATISSNNASIKIQGADHIVIDGSNNGTNSRNLNILSTGTTAMVWICAHSNTDGAENVVIKNCNLTGDNTTKFGIYSGSNQFTSTSTGPLAPTSYNRYENNAISKVLYGIYLTGISKSRQGINNKFIGNVLGDAINSIGVRGIYTNFSLGDTVTGNVVQNLNYTLTNSYIQSSGIYLDQCKQALVSANKVTNFRSTAGDTYLSGIWVNGGEDGWSSPVMPTNNIVVNNFIGNGYSSSTQTYSVSGLIVEYGAFDKVYFNTVSLTGSLLKTSGNVTAFRSGDYNLQNYDIRNNIFYINGSSTSSALFYAHLTYSNYSFNGTVSDYNLMYAAATGSASAYIGEHDYTQYGNLASWQSGTSGDANSKSAVVNFVSATDLHVAGASIGDFTNLSGVAIAGFTTDIDGQTRHTIPYMGADENTANPLPVKLLSFGAIASNNDVIVNWLTAEEMNNKGFAVERSLDNKQFEEVTFVKGKNGKSQNSYQFADINAFDKGSVIYYRLRQEDNNGMTEYSKSVQVSKTEKVNAAVAVYPNPFIKELLVQVTTNEASTVELTLFDIAGRVMNVSTHQLTKGANKINVDNIGDLQSGIYFLSIKTLQGIEVHKVVKQ